MIPYMSGSPEKEAKKKTVRNKQDFPNRKTALFESKCDGTYHIRLSGVCANRQ